MLWGPARDTDVGLVELPFIEPHPPLPEVEAVVRGVCRSAESSAQRVAGRERGAGSTEPTWATARTEEEGVLGLVELCQLLPDIGHNVVDKCERSQSPPPDVVRLPLPLRTHRLHVPQPAPAVATAF